MVSADLTAAARGPSPARGALSQPGVAGGGRPATAPRRGGRSRHAPAGGRRARPGGRGAVPGPPIRLPASLDDRLDHLGLEHRRPPRL